MATGDRQDEAACFTSADRRRRVRAHLLGCMGWAVGRGRTVSTVTMDYALGLLLHSLFPNGLPIHLSFREV